MFALTWCLISILNGADTPHSSLKDAVVRLEPSGATFKIPEKWLAAHRDGRKNLHLTRDELKPVHGGEGEWDTEYAQVINSVLSFDRCAAHVGSEGWGKDGVSFADLQMRAYVGDWKLDDLTNTLAAKGFATAKTLSAKATLETIAVDKWQRNRIKMPLFFIDYGATANVEFYARTFGKETVVLVFMYTDGRGRDKEVETILKSFEHP